MFPGKPWSFLRTTVYQSPGLQIPVFEAGIPVRNGNGSASSNCSFYSILHWLLWLNGCPDFYSQLLMMGILFCVPLAPLLGCSLKLKGAILKPHGLSALFFTDSSSILVCPHFLSAPTAAAIRGTDTYPYIESQPQATRARMMKLQLEPCFSHCTSLRSPNPYMHLPTGLPLSSSSSNCFPS